MIDGHSLNQGACEKMNEESLFHRALEKPPEGRPSFLDEACAGDPELRRRLDELLAAHHQQDDLLHRPLAAFAEISQSSAPTGSANPEKDVRLNAASKPDEASGAVVAGRYRLLETIGEGGMGTVWMAEQREPVKRLVALKLIKPGMASKTVVARFEAERQALALMDHPNIARVFDGGTAENGCPFFVMELVRGISLTQYCDERRLSIAERLNLFTQICHAVQHAHQKGVIHRDLKPANILVTEHDGRPVPKVIDFGLAKALQGVNSLTEHTLYTNFGAMVGTPLYMAPEQVSISALDVDTRADIYALGVVLYELLTGSTPLDRQVFKKAAWDEICRLIREEEPQRPSLRLSDSETLASIAACRHSEPARLGRLLRGDLDWIVLKSLEKDRNRRYETASSLAIDLQRYLANEPVSACPPSGFYRFRKMLRRNKLACAASGAVAAALTIGSIVSAYFAMEAGRKADDAMRSERVARSALIKADESTRDSAIEREGAKDSLLRSLYDQARFVMATTQIGRRWMALDLLRQAEALRARDRLGIAPPSEPLPSRSELRSEAVTALLTPDARLVREMTVSDVHAVFGGLPTVVSADGELAVGWWTSEGMAHGKDENNESRLSVRVMDVMRAHEVLRQPWHSPDIPQCVGISRDGKLYAVGQIKSNGETPVGFQVCLWQLPEFHKTENVLDWPNYSAGDRAAVPLELLFSPDGDLLAAVRHRSNQLDIAVWDLQKGTSRTYRRSQLPGGKWGPSSFTPDGKRLAVRTEGKKICFVNLSDDSSTEIELPLRCVGPIAFSTSQSVLAVVCDDSGDTSGLVWDYANNREQYRIKSGEGHGVAFDPGGKRLAFASEQGIDIYDVPGFSRIQRMESAASLVGYLQALQWTSDGRHVISVGGFDGTLKLWELSAQKPLTAMRIGGAPFSDFVFSPSGKWVLPQPEAGSIARLVNRATGKVDREFPGIDANHLFVFRNDSRQLAILPTANSQQAVVVDLQTGREVLRRSMDRRCVSGVFDPAGELIISVLDNPEITIRNLTTNQVPWKPAPEAKYDKPYFSSDGKVVALVSSDVAGRRPSAIYELSFGRKLVDLQSPQPGLVPNFVFSRNSSLAAAASMSLPGFGGMLGRSSAPTAAAGGDARVETSVAVWSVPSGNQSWALHFVVPCAPHCFSPNGKLLLILAPNNNDVQLWRSARPEEVFHFNLRARNVTFTPDGQFLAWCEPHSRQIDLLDLNSLRQQLAVIKLDW